MNIKTKLIVGSSILTIIPLLIVSIVIGWQAINEGEKALRDQVVNRLIASRDDKAVQVKHYFTGIRDQLTTFSHDQMFIDAMLSFKDAYINIKEEVLDEATTDEYREKLKNYYQTQYNNYFTKLNPGKPAENAQFYETLSDEGVILQVHYAVNNSNSLPYKDKLDDPDDDTLYSQIHSLYHEKFREFKQRFGYYDIFLIETENDNIVYSVNKEADFGASAKQAIFKNTQLENVYQQAKASKDPNFIAISDYSLYSGSFNLVSAFLAAPIISDEEQLGVMVFQIPQTTINRIMTSEKKWKQVGMGNSGESYLVGFDGKARSISRFLLENQQQFLSLLESDGIDLEVIKMIKARKSNVLLEEYKTNPALKISQGVKGFSDSVNSVNIEVMSAYAPLQISGLKWGIISEIHQSEALAPVKKLSQKIIISAFIIFFSLLVISTIIALIFARNLTLPIIKLNKVINDVKEHCDLTQHIDFKHNHKDEIGSMASAFNTMIDTFHQSIKEVSIAVNYIANAAQTLMNLAEQTKEAIVIQNTEAAEISNNMKQMLDKTNQVDSSINQASKVSDSAVKYISSGQNIVNKTIESIKKVSTQISQSADSLHNLAQETNNIGSVVEVIREIAEQTNLLALNAAIEAARAGEQGRGFAVVADEVRNLAAKTQNATTQIQLMVEKLQKGSGDSVQVMNESKVHTKQVQEQSKLVVSAFETISSAVSEISKLNTQITLIVEYQKNYVEKIDANIDKITKESSKTTAASDEIATSSEILTEMSTNLQALVNQFKIAPNFDLDDSSKETLNNYLNRQ
jgi:methyl-accepting chemotaxis protein